MVQRRYVTGNTCALSVISRLSFASPGYDTSRTSISHNLPPVHPITNILRALLVLDKVSIINSRVLIQGLTVPITCFGQILDFEISLCVIITKYDCNGKKFSSNGNILSTAQVKSFFVLYNLSIYIDLWLNIFCCSLKNIKYAEYLLGLC